MNTRKRTKVEGKQTCSSSKRPRRENNSAGESKNMWQASEVILQVERTFRTHGKAADAVAMKRYMRDKFDFFGVKSQQRRELCREVLRGKAKDLESNDVRHFVLSLWEKCHRELQYFAMDFLEKQKLKLFQDERDFDQNIEFLKTLLVTKSWWDTVDMIATKFVGHLVQTHREKGTKVMEDWIKSDDLWLRRTAILHQLTHKANTDSDLLFRFCLCRCHEQEFFIRKAIGWALREYAKVQPSKVKQFLLKNKGALSKLSYNEASKHLGLPRK